MRCRPIRCRTGCAATLCTGARVRPRHRPTAPWRRTNPPGSSPTYASRARRETLALPRGRPTLLVSRRNPCCALPRGAKPLRAVDRSRRERLRDGFVHCRSDFGHLEAPADVDHVTVLPTIADVDAAPHDLEHATGDIT